MLRWQTGKVMETYNLKDYTIPEIEKLLEASPWFAIARKELFLKMSAMGEEYRRDALHRTVLYLYPEYSVFREGYVLSSAALVEEREKRASEQVYELDFTPMDEPRTPAPQSATGESRREIYVVGGDYFLPEELKNVQNQDITTLQSKPEPIMTGDSSEFTDEAYYTETLARIYADQELYDRANEVYEKLILLYPEKSAYFAALKNDIKKHLATRHSACARQLTFSRKPHGHLPSSYLPCVFWQQPSLLPADRVTMPFSRDLSRPAPTQVRLSSPPLFPEVRLLPLIL